MICIAGRLPVLQVGKYQVCGYDTDWIKVGLENAAERAGQTDFPFIEDIYDSIVHYLEHKCPLRLLPVEQLNERIVFMLKRIGCEHIAKALPLMAPPITISLEEAAFEAGDNFELGFFANLKSEIDDAKRAGAAAVIFEDVIKSVCILTKKEEWDESCDQLEKDILNYIKGLGETPRRQSKGRRIHIPLDAILQHPIS
jgi:hypothetical protein